MLHVHPIRANGSPTAAPSMRQGKPSTSPSRSTSSPVSPRSKAGEQRRRRRIHQTFKRDYVRVNPLPNAATAIAATASWMDDYNEVHPHSRLAYRPPRENIRDQSQLAACLV